MSALSIIIPCYNEEQRLSLERLTSFLTTYSDTRLVLVNDGSTDNTAKMLSELNSMFPQHVNVVNLEKKSGKAEAVRIGMLESVKNKEYTHHGYIDADLAVSPEELYRLYEVMKSFRYKFIFGSRIKKIGTSIKRNEWRHFYSRIIATIVDSIIRLGVYDTQCSAKIFIPEVIQPIFEKKFHTKWLFDVELICRIHNLYGELNTNGTEEPVLSWTEMKGSKLRWFNFFSIIKEVMVLKKNYSSSK